MGEQPRIPREDRHGESEKCLRPRPTGDNVTVLPVYGDLIYQVRFPAAISIKPLRRPLTRSAEFTLYGSVGYWLRCAEAAISSMSLAASFG
jgi:hypothetical protein